MEYGLIGERLGHSYSRLIHRSLASYDYELREVAPAELDGFLKARAFRGLNVTIPYKQAVMQYCASLSEAARAVGSVNTLIVRPDGTLLGHNTDLGGFIGMLRRAEIDPRGKKCVVLGSGGTSLTAQAALRQLAAKEVVVVSRRGEVNYEALYARHADAEILVNATPVGMYPGNGVRPADIARLPRLSGVVDVIYNPERTALILDAQARGIPCVSGLWMLAAQAREAASLFSGAPIDEARVERVCEEIRGQTLNLVLIGMPGCGKSTLGALLSARMRRPWVDTDQLVEQRAGLSVPELFARDGEARFRALETEALEAACAGSGQIVCVGGGAVLREENVRAMRQNARVVWIRRAPEKLSLADRPLSTSREAVFRLFRERRARYAATCDFTVENDGAPEDAARAAEEGFYEAARH